MVVIAKDYYRSMFEKTDGVTVQWNTYSLDPLNTSGGGTVLSGTYDLPSIKSPSQPNGAPSALTVYNELQTNAAQAAGMRPFYGSPGFFAGKNWGDELDPLSTDGFLMVVDSATIHDEDLTIALTTKTQDGSTVTARMNDALGALVSPQTVAEMLIKIFGITAIQVTSDMTTTPWTGYFSILSGPINDMVRAVASGLGANICFYSTGAATTPNFVKVTKRPRPIRLINPGTIDRNIITPDYTPSVKVTNYNSSRGQNVVYFKAEEIYKIDANATQEVRINVQGTPGATSLVQPVAVTSIPTIPYLGPNSIYCVTDNDGYEASNKFTALGGKVTVAVGDTPDELVLNITGPTIDDGSSYTLSEGTDNPALYISATDGTLWKPIEYTVPTGAVPQIGAFNPATTPPVIDNTLLCNADLAMSAAMRAITKNAGVHMTVDSVTFSGAVDLTTGVPVLPDEIASAAFRHRGSMWRITSLQYSSSEATYTAAAEQHTTIGDFNGDFGTMTIAQWSAYATGIYGALPTCREFALEPLRLD